jgi:hypothetical protein
MRLPRAQFRIRRMIVAVAALGIVLRLGRYVFVEESPDHLLLAILHGQSTLYARGYDKSRFRAIRLGMTAPQVEGLVGAPLERMPAWWCTGDDLWLYTHGGKQLQEEVGRVPERQARQGDERLLCRLRIAVVPVARAATLDWFLGCTRPGWVIELVWALAEVGSREHYYYSIS